MNDPLLSAAHELAERGLVQVTAEEFPRLLITEAGRSALGAETLLSLSGLTRVTSFGSSPREPEEALRIAHDGIGPRRRAIRRRKACRSPTPRHIESPAGLVSCPMPASLFGELPGLFFDVDRQAPRTVEKGRAIEDEMVVTLDLLAAPLPPRSPVEVGHLKLSGIADHVEVGDDVALGVEHDPRSQPTTRGNLDNRRPHLVDDTDKGLLERGRRVCVVGDAIESLNPEESRKTLDELQSMGAELVSTDQLLARFQLVSA